jgi:hypothetical protein
MYLCIYVFNGSDFVGDDTLLNFCNREKKREVCGNMKKKEKKKAGTKCEEDGKLLVLEQFSVR